ncbi:MAG: sulfatase-like hydrolase/transferase [Armatimonadetes bacterium]|nr:sulfatase-like hydrolase/transferase [Armatimonadota bacterium]
MRRPNLLFLYTDEQSVSTLGAYGNPVVETPNLDHLARTSTVFERAYVTQPVCTPSRSSILTGLYPHSNGCTANNIPLDEAIPCLPEMGDFSAWRKAHMGKWHLGDEVFVQHGFDEWVSIEDGYRKYYRPHRDRNTHCDYWHWLVERGIEPPDSDGFGRGFAARLPEEHSKPAFLAERASQFIRDNQQRPWILYVNFLEPHMPYHGPRDDMYDRSRVPLPDNFDAVPGPEQHLKSRLLAEHYRHAGPDGPMRDEEHWRDLIARYWGLCSEVDTHAGAILDTLSECGLDENTIVVYTSDHGDMMGSHQLVAKCVMYEEAVRVPLLLRVPWLDADPERVETPVSHVDLVPTLLDLMGVGVPGHLQGRSWRPELRRGEMQARDVVIEWNGSDNGGIPLDEQSYPDYLKPLASREEALEAITDPVRTIITPTGWKCTCSPRGEHEMYNLREDPGETVNLMGERAVSMLARDLYDRLVQWQKQTGDHVELSANGVI